MKHGTALFKILSLLFEAAVLCTSIGLFVLCGFPEPDLREHTWGLLIYFHSILEHALENRVGTFKA